MQEDRALLGAAGRQSGVLQGTRRKKSGKKGQERL